MTFSRFAAKGRYIRGGESATIPAVTWRLARAGADERQNPKPQTAKQHLAKWDAKFCVVRFGGKTRIFTWEKSPVHRDAVMTFGWCAKHRTWLARKRFGRIANSPIRDCDGFHIAKFGRFLATGVKKVRTIPACSGNFRHCRRSVPSSLN